MTGPQIDYAAVFQNLPMPVMLMTPEFVMADVNQAYVEKAGRSREELVGQKVFDAFPDNPADPGATGVSNLSASLHRVLATGECDTMELQRYDVEVVGQPGQFTARYWCPVNAPVLGPDGEVVLVAHCVEEVTDRLAKFVDKLSAEAIYDRPG
jgi:PAS domain-containing protein